MTPDGRHVANDHEPTDAAARAARKRGAALTARLHPVGYTGRPEQVILFTVAAWDANCPQHIPRRFEAADVAAVLAERDAKISALEAEVARLAARMV